MQQAQVQQAQVAPIPPWRQYAQQIPPAPKSAATTEPPSPTGAAVDGTGATAPAPAATPPAADGQDGTGPPGPAATPPAADGQDGTGPPGPAATPPAADGQDGTGATAPAPAAPTPAAGSDPVKGQWLRRCNKCHCQSYWRENACLNPRRAVSWYKYNAEGGAISPGFGVM